jgi:hypothetical protein
MAKLTGNHLIAIIKERSKEGSIPIKENQMTENRYTQIADTAIAEVKKIDCEDVAAAKGPSLLAKALVASNFGPLGIAYVMRSKWFGVDNKEEQSRIDSCETDKQNRLKTLEGQKAEALKM